MVIRYPATKARVNFGEIIEQVADKGHEVIIDRLGHPVVRITPYSKVPLTIEQIRARLAAYTKGKDSVKAVRKHRDGR